MIPWRQWRRRRVRSWRFNKGTKVAGFVSAGLINPEKKQHETVITADGGAGANGEEIDVGEEEEEGNDDEGELMQKSIPAAVLGGLASRK